MLRRVQRRTAVICVVCAVAALVWAPDRPRLALGVLGGGVLVGVAFWALSGVVGALTGAGAARGGVLVKFFTRHAILAVGAYVMMVRLHLDPIGMLVGVTSVVVAATLEATRLR